jgi:cysteine desulfurase
MERRSLNNQIYLDNNSTTDLSPSVLGGLEIRLKLATTKERRTEHMKLCAESVRTAIGAKGGKVVFTSGGTENAAIAFATAASTDPGRLKAIVSLMDHISVLNQYGSYMSKFAKDVDIIIPDLNTGQPRPDQFRDALKEDTQLVVLTLVNSETGVLCDVASYAAAVKEKSDALVFVDACQAIGKMEMVDIPDCIDMVSISGHKFHAPRGVGALWTREGINAIPAWGGGFQQYGMRAGTENFLGVIGMSHALETLDRDGGNGYDLMMPERQYMDEEIVKRISDVHINFDSASRVCNTSNYHIKGVDARVLSLLLKKYNIITSATVSGLQDTTAASPLMRYLYEESDCHSNLRVSLSKFIRRPQLDTFIERLDRAVDVLRSQS